MKNNILAVILARGGSKGIPKKNIYNISGHPLLSYSLQAAKESRFINKIIVSTDSLEIAKTARAYGAETPFLRSKKLATDETTSVDALHDAVIRCEKIYKTIFDYIFCLNAINHVSDLDACWDRLFAVAHKDSRLLISIDAHNYSLFKYLFRLLPGDILHPHQYDLKEYQEMIEKRGGHIEFILNKKKEFFFNYYVLSVVLNPKT